MHIGKVVFAASALALASLTAGAPPAAAEDFYKDKTVTVQVPSGSGGTYHVYCQIVAGQIGRHIPGKPQVIIQNLPGAGGAKSASYMMNAAPKDGSYIAMIAPGNLTTPLVRKVKFDARKFQWLGSVAARPFSLAVWHTVPVKTWEDMKKTEVTMGTSGTGSAGYVIPAFVNAALGTRIRIITGYKSGGETNLAMERGEIHGRGNFYSGFTGVRPDWITDKKIRFILGIGPRHPELKAVPHLRDLLKPGSEMAKVYDLIELNFNVGQAFYTPPGVAADQVGVLRKAFAGMLADPALVKEIEKRRVEFQPKDWKAVQRQIDDGFISAEPAVVKRLKAVMGIKESKT
jgi:tripartite-type tricarboxylate transporter receptor subunit TctC